MMTLRRRKLKSVSRLFDSAIQSSELPHGCVAFYLIVDKLGKFTTLLSTIPRDTKYKCVKIKTRVRIG